MNLKVLTYNVFGMPWGNQSIESVILWCLYKTDAEILCFQEVFSADQKGVIQTICGRTESQWSCWFPETQPTLLSQWVPSFSSISGLCILTKKPIQILETPVFIPFTSSAGLDRFVQKGFFHIVCKKEDTLIHLITTHLQSDFTECCFHYSYQSERILQEIELYDYARRLPNALLVGDFNGSRFYHFTFVNSPREVTFRETGESLDHCLVLPRSAIHCKEAQYFHEVSFSDHIPVLFHLRFIPSSI